MAFPCICAGDAGIRRIYTAMKHRFSFRFSVILLTALLLFSAVLPAAAQTVVAEVTLTPSDAEIEPGETVDITVTADGTQNCADIVLTYDPDVFTYTKAARGGVLVPETPDGTLRLLDYNTAGETLNTLTFTANETVAKTTEAKFGFTSAKFAESVDAMSNDAQEAQKKTGTTVTVLVPYFKAAFVVDDSTTELDVRKDTNPDSGKIPSDDSVKKTGYQFLGWNCDGRLMTAAQIAQLTFTENMSFTAEYALDASVSLYSDYVGGYTEIVVNGVLDGYAYDGVSMYKIADDTFAVLVPGAVTEADAAAMLSEAAEDASRDLTDDMKNDVNATGVFDIADVRAAFNCQNVLVDVSAYMDVYLRADVNGDHVVNSNDVTALYTALSAS